VPITAVASDPEVDVVVIGGGVNGTGVARDLALRSLRVTLIERHDLAFGASGNSSGMIHGGVRYLTSNPKVTRLSCLDSGYIQRIAPHLLFRIPFLVPVDRALGSSIFLDLVDAFFGAYDRFQPLKRGKPHTRLTPAQVRTIEPGITGDISGAVTFDEWGIDGARLCLANALDAHEHGASILVHTTVERILRRDDGAVQGVIWRDRLTGASGTIRCRVVVSASGAWAPITASLASIDPIHARVRPGKGVHVVFDRRLSNYAIATYAIDGRQVFLEPWENVTVLGTTDTDFYGDLDDVSATSDEVRYLVQGLAKMMPSLRQARMIGTYAGVRPTLYAYGPITNKLSREHQIIDHAQHGADGLYSMIGGKLASYRIFAEEMSDVVARRLGCDRPCTTHVVPLPGGDRAVDVSDLATACGIDLVSARRLAYRHGSRSIEVGELIRGTRRGADVVCTCEAVTDAEIRHVVRKEFVRTVDDVARRTRLGLGPCGGMRCAVRCGMVLADELRMDPREGLAMAMRFTHRQARARAVCLGPTQARQEALAIAAFRAHLGLGSWEPW